MPSIISPNMSLIEPTVGGQPSPTWAVDINTNFSIIDSHNHSAGSGVQITPSGLDISSDLTFQGNDAIALRSTRYSIQSAVLATASDLACAYAVGSAGDLYWNDNSGNKIQITASGGVVGTPGSISGLASPAAATYVPVTGTFVWTRSAGVGANMDAATYVLRYPGSYPAPSGNYILLQAPSSLSGGYAITFPGSAPASTKIMQMDSSGNISAALAVDNSSIEISTNTLQVKAGGITGTMLNANVVDNSSLQLTSNVLSIKDSGVTNAKIQDNPIFPGTHFSSASSTGLLYGTGNTYNIGNNDANCLMLGYKGSLTGYRIISGEIGVAGGVTSGEGFTSGLSNTNRFTITLNITGSGTPIGTANIRNPTAGSVTIRNFSSSSFEFLTWDAAGMASAQPFQFIIIIPN